MPRWFVFLPHSLIKFLWYGLEQRGGVHVPIQGCGGLLRDRKVSCGSRAPRCRAFHWETHDGGNQRKRKGTYW